MGFRFRKSFKIAPGIKINLSKSGLSTSVGKNGASLNFGNRGIRATVGLPGTGVSASKLFASKTDALPNHSPAELETYQQTIIDAQPAKPKVKIPFGCLIPVVFVATCYQLFFCSAIVSAIINPPPTPTPTLTATATQPPTSTPRPTQTSLPTITPQPSQTTTPIHTKTPYLTPTLPAQCLQEYPSFCILPGQRIVCDQLPADFVVLPPDSLGYDKDGDGIGCEN